VEIGCRNVGWAGVAVGLRCRGRCVGGMFWLGHSDDGLSGGGALGARSRSGGYFSGGYFSGGYFSGGYFSGGYFSGGYFSGGYFSGGYFSGSFIGCALEEGEGGGEEGQTL
jgi:hypothetical protein